MENSNQNTNSNTPPEWFLQSVAEYDQQPQKKPNNIFKMILVSFGIVALIVLFAFILMSGGSRFNLSNYFGKELACTTKNEYGDYDLKITFSKDKMKIISNSEVGSLTSVNDYKVKSSEKNALILNNSNTEWSFDNDKPEKMDGEYESKIDYSNYKKGELSLIVKDTATVCKI